MYNDGMENKIIWIIDNPYADKWTATKTTDGTTTDITKSKALTMAKNLGVFISAKADRQLRAQPIVSRALEQYTGVKADWNTKSEYYHG